MMDFENVFLGWMKQRFSKNFDCSQCLNPLRSFSSIFFFFFCLIDFTLNIKISSLKLVRFDMVPFKLKFSISSGCTPGS